MDAIDACKQMTDDELLESLDRLAAADRTLNRDLLAHLAVIDSRGSTKKRGYSTLYVYCTTRLKFSETEAYRRIAAARLAMSHRQILTMVERAEVNLSTLMAVNPILNQKNAEEVLTRIKGKSKREAEMIAASVDPGPARRDFMARKPIPTGSAEWPSAPTPTPASPSTAQPSQPISFSFDKIEAVDGQKVRLHFDVGPETAKLLERAREVMRHKFPMASFEDIVKEALKLLLEERDPEIKLKLEKEDAKKVLTDARRVPVWVQRKVWRRDGGRCAYVAEDGTRCEERKWLEYDHIVPYAKGGRSDDPKNIRLLCRSHNQLAGWLEFPPGPTASA